MIMKTLCPKCWKKYKLEMKQCPKCKVALVEPEHDNIDKKELKDIDKKVKFAKLHSTQKEDALMVDVKDKLLTQTKWIMYLLIGLFVIFFGMVLVYFFMK